MGYPAFTWTPAGSSTPRSVDFSAIKGWKRFEVQAAVDRAVTISRRRVPVTVVSDSFFQIEVEFEAFGPSDRAFYHSLWSWESFAMSGGVFSLAYDSSLNKATALTAPAADTATSLTVTSTTGFSAGDPVYLEDAYDSTIFTRGKVDSVASGTGISVLDALGVKLTAGSVFRHAEYFPYCYLLEDHSPFKERPAGEGVGMWDFKGTIVTVRSS
jgi:hypothetical protein